LRELLERVGLGGRADHRPAQLSGGERQRAAVVRALINRPRLLLADEPTGSLDGEAAARLADLLAELNASEGVTLVTVTHSDVLAARAGRVLRLESGRLVPAAQPAG
jgi:predicted ABC-type transport system involved in lysophospholipase L1 biosynthesis ATPase subunit